MLLEYEVIPQTPDFPSMDRYPIYLMKDPSFDPQPKEIPLSEYPSYPTLWMIHKPQKIQIKTYHIGKNTVPL